MHLYRCVLPVLGVGVLLPAIGLAQSETPANAGPLDSVQQQPLLGNWAPRKQLEDRGIDLSARWILEPAVNDRGYKGSGMNVVSHLNVNAVLDLGKLDLLDNSKVQIVITHLGSQVLGPRLVKCLGAIENKGDPQKC